MQRRQFRFVPLLFVIALFMSGCGRRPAEPTPSSAPAPPRPAPVALTGGNLLAAPGAVIQCDSAEGATISCTAAQAETDGAMNGVQEIAVESNAGVYARWSWRADTVEAPLSGVETLLLAVDAEGELDPNLYLVEQDGARIPVSLRRAGLRQGANNLHIPLAEIKDEVGQQPDYSRVAEVQIVFEWSDNAGTMTISDLRFLPRWEEAIEVDESARTLAAALGVPEGFVVDPIADNLQSMTQVVYTESGDLLASLQNGRVWWYRDQNGDGVFDSRHLYSAGTTEIVGLLPDPVDGSVWIGGRGELSQLYDDDGDGVADRREVRVTGLPWGRHQNNGLAWNPAPDPFSGEDGPVWIYFGLGSTGDLENGSPINSTILRFPRTGRSANELEVVSRGNRNAYMITWAQVPMDLAQPDGPAAWQLFASENGPDFNDAPDEVNHIRPGRHYGFPVQFGPVEPPAEDGFPYSGPIYPVTAHASASGLAYVGNPDWPVEFRTLYLSLFGQVFSDAVVGHTVEGVRLRTVEAADGPTYRGEPFDFVTGLDRPLPMTTDLAGDLLVGDYATGVLYRIRYSDSGR